MSRSYKVESSTNGLVEDLGSIIGFTATTRLVGWFGGTTLYIPLTSDDKSHVICRCIGESAFKQLVENFPQELLKIPRLTQLDIIRRDRAIGERICTGESLKAIAKSSGLTERSVAFIRRRLEELGLMPVIITGRKRGGLDVRV